MIQLVNFYIFFTAAFQEAKSKRKYSKSHKHIKALICNILQKNAIITYAKKIQTASAKNSPSNCVKDYQNGIYSKIRV